VDRRARLALAAWGRIAMGIVIEERDPKKILKMRKMLAASIKQTEATIAKMQANNEKMKEALKNLGSRNQNTVGRAMIDCEAFASLSQTLLKDFSKAQKVQVAAIKTVKK
jgi:hypothetical protein